MKKLLLSVAVLAMVCGTADAQSLLQRLGDKAKEAAEKNLGEKIEKGVNNALDGKSKKNKGKKGKEVVEEEAQEVAAEKAVAIEAWTCKECGKPEIPVSSATTAAPKSPVPRPLPPSPKSRWKPLMQRVTLSRETRFSLRILLKMSSWESSRHSGI